MRIAELKTLDKFAKSDKTYEFLQHVFVSGEFVYACTPYSIIQIWCKELARNIVNLKFKPVDIAKAQACSDRKRYVDLTECLSDESGYWDEWERDYFDRFFKMKISHSGKYDPKYLTKIMQVVKAFKLNMTFEYNAENGLVTFRAFDSNYNLHALLMPIS